jgi:hypothetical protein
MTFGQRHRLARDTALYLAWQAGMSQNALALAFLLARASVGRIIRVMAARAVRSGAIR